EALGIYGLTQGLLQIPFGLLSDKFGRKIMIVIGLLLFGLGSAIAALSGTIAAVADLTAEETRTKAMAMIGMTIGASFIVALVAGPVVAKFIGVGGIFWLMAALALAGIAITEFVVPNPPRISVHRDAETVPALMGLALRNKELLRLNFGIFALHA